MICKAVLITMVTIGIIEILSGTFDSKGKRQLKKAAEKIERKQDEV